MRIPLIALGVLLAAGCNAPNDDTAAPSTPDAQRPASAPTPQPEPQSPEDSSTTATVPEQFRGAYAADASACTSPGHVTQLDIGASTIGFHESSGDVISVESSGNDVGITAELTGEGETYQVTYSFQLSEDGKTLTDTVNGMSRVRCG